MTPTISPGRRSSIRPRPSRSSRACSGSCTRRDPAGVLTTIVDPFTLSIGPLTISGSSPATPSPSEGRSVGAGVPRPAPRLYLAGIVGSVGAPDEAAEVALGTLVAPATGVGCAGRAFADWIAL